jgi:hypothetical protein
MPSSLQFLAVCKQCKAFCCTIVRPLLTEKEKHDILEAGFSIIPLYIGKRNTTGKERSKYYTSYNH